MTEIEEITHFIKAQHMGIEVFSVLNEKAKGLKVKEEFNNDIEILKTRLAELEDYYRKNFHSPLEPMTFFQKRAITMMRMKKCGVKTDKGLLRLALKSMAMGTVGALKYIEKLDFNDVERNRLIKATLQDYADIYTSILTFLTERIGA